MFPWLLVLVLPSAYSLYCPYVFDGKRYDKQSIVTIDGYPDFLQIEPTTNDLIFSLANNKFHFSGIYILKSGTLVKVDIKEAYVAATDFKHNRVFIGTGSGLKLLNNKNQASMDFASLQNESIMRLFKPIAEDKLYYITYPNRTVQQLDLNTFEKSEVKLESLVWDVVVDLYGNIFYRTVSWEYKVLLKGSNDPIKFVGLNSVNHGLTVDDNNRVIANTQNGLYWLKTDSAVPTKLMDLEFLPYNVMFDREDIYITTLNTIYKFSNKYC